MGAEIIFFNLSPPQRPVRVVGRLGRKEKRALSIFSIIAIFIQRSLCGGEISLAEIKISRTNLARDNGYSCDFWNLASKADFNMNPQKVKRIATFPYGLWWA